MGRPLVPRACRRRCCRMPAVAAAAAGSAATAVEPHTHTYSRLLYAGDDEEIERFWKEMGLMEKGKVLVKGILS